MKAKALILIALLLPCLAVGCGQEPPATTLSQSRIISLYDQLKIGMTKPEVQAILGEPIYSLRQQTGEEQCEYIKEPENKMESHESPMMVGGIYVSYKDDKLVKSTYNSQWVKREHREAYEHEKKSEQAASSNH